MTRVEGTARSPLGRRLAPAVALGLTALAALISAAPTVAQKVVVHVDVVREFSIGSAPDTEFRVEVREGIPPDERHELRIDCIAGCKGAAPYRDWVGHPFSSAIHQASDNGPVVTLWKNGTGFKVIVLLLRAEGITRVLETDSVSPPSVRLGPNGATRIDIETSVAGAEATSPVRIRHEWDAAASRFRQQP